MAPVTLQEKNKGPSRPVWLTNRRAQPSGRRLVAGGASPSVHGVPGAHPGSQNNPAICQTFTGHGCQQMLVGRMLGASRVRVGHPQRGRPSWSAKMSLGSEPARLGSSVAGWPALACSEGHRPVHPGLCRSRPRGAAVHAHGDFDLVEAMRVQVLAQRGLHVLPIGAHHKAQLAVRHRLRRDGVDGPLRVARAQRQHLQRVPAHQLFGGVRPNSPQPGVSAGSSASVPIHHVFEGSAQLVGHHRRQQAFDDRMRPSRPPAWPVRA